MSNLLIVNLWILNSILIKAVGIKKHWVGSVLCFFFVLFNYSMVASEISSQAGSEEFSFVSVTAYARPAGLASAYTALAEGMDAVSSNPAGLALLKKENWASLGFKKNILDVNSGELTLFKKDKKFNYALSIHYINYGSIKYLDEKNQSLGNDLLPMSLNPSFTAAYKWQKKLRAGVTVKIPMEYLGDFQGSQMGLAWATDLGLQYQPALKRVKFGAVLLNIGRKERDQIENAGGGEMLPSEFKAGLVYQGLGNKNTLISFDIGVPWHYQTYTSLGFEYSLTRDVIFRGGTRWNVDELETFYREFVLNEALPPPGKNDMKLATGITLKQKKWIIDYAAQWWLNLGFQHWVTLKVGY